MKKTLFLIIILSALLAFALSACGGDEPAPTEAPAAEQPAPAEADPTEPPAEEPVEEPAVELFGDALRGGLLYDKWWKVTGADEPEGDHPLWGTQESNTRSGADTWRCKECHGWDYMGVDGAYGSGSHMTGFAGVFGLSGTDPNGILAAMKGETNSDHDFSSYMDEQALTDVSLFISEELLDSADVVDGDKMSLSSDVAGGEALFTDTCADCHGPEGLAINFKSNVASPEYMPGLASGNPWEFMNKLRFGQPGESDMPSALDLGWTLDEQASVLAFVQTLPEVNLATQGGQIYDKWWKALGIDEPEGDQALWATQDTNERSGADTWRCKECHGWDYQGADGAYGSGSHFTGFTGVYGAVSMPADELTGWLDGSANGDHDFSAYLDEAAIGMMVAFIQEGLVDMGPYINEDKSVNGDAASGEGLFSQACARCHGDDGKTLNFGDDAEPEYVGGLANGNPWEVLHKAANGQPASHMTIGRNMGWSWDELVNLLSYLQTLPE